MSIPIRFYSLPEQTNFVYDLLLLCVSLTLLEKLFSDKGLKETTVDDISKAADCSKSTIYVYFKSKDEIYNFIIYDYMSKLHDSVNSCIEKYNHFERCYFQICAVLVKNYEQHPFFFKA